LTYLFLPQIATLFVRKDFQLISSSLQIADTLGKIATQTNKKSAVIYLIPRSQRLELVLITAQGQPVYKRVLEAKREVLLQQVQELNNFVANPTYRNNNRYLSSAQQLYRWMISPIEADPRWSLADCQREYHSPIPTIGLLLQSLVTLGSL
jgi:Uncharacterized protein conserved in bacteria